MCFSFRDPLGGWASVYEEEQVGGGGREEPPAELSIVRLHWRCEEGPA